MKSSNKLKKNGHVRFSNPMIAIVIAISAIAAISFSLNARTSNRVYASPKKYKGTKEVVVDRQTGQRRLPNQAEVDEMVATLSTLASRPEGLPQTPGVVGGMTVDLQGSYGGVMLARPNEDLSWESKCVFTFAEGAEFLGLVADDSTE
jgi:hypothetical protein